MPASCCAAAGSTNFLPAPCFPPPGRKEGPFIDGGIRCRIGLDLWRQHRYAGNGGSAAPAVVHLIGRSSPFSGNDNTAGLGAPAWLPVSLTASAYPEAAPEVPAAAVSA